MNAIIILSVWGIFLMLGGLFLHRKSQVRGIAILGLLLALAASWVDYHRGTPALFRGMLESSPFSVVFYSVLIGGTLLYFLLSGRDFASVGEYLPEYYALIFFILAGIGLAITFSNLLMLFLAIEIMSIPQYILAGSEKKNPKSHEASLKYFLMGAFSTGFLLLGIALLYGASGTFSIRDMQLGTGPLDPLALVGVLLLLFSLSFKVSAVPFHFWAPDVYDGSPTVFTSFMATIVKAGSFLAFIRLFHNAFEGGDLSSRWIMVLSIITAATLLLGNLTAVFQHSVKRMLAYSSIAQAGFMLLAVIALNRTAEQGILLYAAAYSVATIGAFAVLVKMKDYSFEGFNGLARKEPVLAATNTIFLLSLAGIPATGGFMAKYFVLTAAVRQGKLLWLVLLAVLCAAISVYYYFRLIAAMYFRQGNPQIEPTGRGFRFMLVLSALILILIGIFPGLLLGGW